MSTPNPEPRWLHVHAEADERHADGYVDPDTGLFVMTRNYLVRRAACCSSSCRHCPY